MDEFQFYNGARAAEKEGFSSLRFNLYDFSDDARKLHNCTLKTHAHDLDVVIDYLREKSAKKIFVVGHSYGGPTILLSKKKKFDGVVLWDPSHKDSFEEETHYIKEIDSYLLKWHAEVRIGKEMYREAEDLDWDALIPNIHVPVKIVAAGESELIPGCKKYLKQANDPKDLTIIKGASHIFHEDGKAEQLFKETFSWFKKYS